MSRIGGVLIFICGCFCLAPVGAQAESSQDTVPNVKGAYIPPGYIEGRNVPGSNDVEKELRCLRQRLIIRNEKNNLLKSDQAGNMIGLLAEPMARSFKKFNMTDPRERAFFYAQIIVESGGFTKLSETTNHTPEKSLSNATPGGAAITQIIEEDRQDPKFHGKSGSAGYGEFRGRGLLQITRCDNYLSVIHYLNLMYRGLPPAWQSGWSYERGGKEVAIAQTCSATDMREMQKEYADEKHMNPNLFGAFEDPLKFGLVGVTLTDDSLPQPKISSAEFMVDTSLAYWKSRCAGIIHNLDPVSLNRYLPCFGNYYQEGDTAEALANKCVTQCVKGSGKQETLRASQERLRYLKDAMACMRQSPH
jgi:hypothetical protein